MMDHATGAALQHLLRLFERKGVITRTDSEIIFEGAKADINDLRARNILSREASADALKTLGYLLIPTGK
jgi:hypothetical protein